MPGFNVPGGGIVFGAPSALQETARRHRWKFEVEPYRGHAIYDHSAEGIVIFAHKCTRPAAEIDSVTIHHSQDEIYLPGKNRWLPIEVSFYEIIGGAFTGVGNRTALWVYKWWSRDVIQIDKSRIAGRGRFAAPVKRRCTLELLNGYGHMIHKYTLYGCWPEKVTPEDLNYEESHICEITMRLRYDKCSERGPR